MLSRLLDHSCLRSTERHDAWSPANFCMARYDADDILKPINRRNTH